MKKICQEEQSVLFSIRKTWHRPKTTVETSQTYKFRCSFARNPTASVVPEIPQIRDPIGVRFSTNVKVKWLDSQKCNVRSLSRRRYKRTTVLFIQVYSIALPIKAENNSSSYLYSFQRSKREIDVRAGFYHGTWANFAEARDNCDSQSLILLAEPRTVGRGLGIRATFCKKEKKSIFSFLCFFFFFLFKHLYWFVIVHQPRK